MDIWAVSCYIYMGVLMALNIVLTILFTVGGFSDLVHLLMELKKGEIDETDDGRVLHP